MCVWSWTEQVYPNRKREQEGSDGRCKIFLSVGGPAEERQCPYPPSYLWNTEVEIQWRRVQTQKWDRRNPKNCCVPSPLYPDESESRGGPEGVPGDEDVRRLWPMGETVASFGRLIETTNVIKDGGVTRVFLRFFRSFRDQWRSHQSVREVLRRDLTLTVQRVNLGSGNRNKPESYERVTSRGGPCSSSSCRPRSSSV